MGLQMDPKCEKIEWLLLYCAVPWGHRSELLLTAFITVIFMQERNMKNRRQNANPTSAFQEGQLTNSRLESNILPLTLSRKDMSVCILKLGVSLATFPILYIGMSKKKASVCFAQIASNSFTEETFSKARGTVNVSFTSPLSLLWVQFSSVSIHKPNMPWKLASETCFSRTFH